jgi:hypothetical protein
MNPQDSSATLVALIAVAILTHSCGSSALSRSDTAVLLELSLSWTPKEATVGDTIAVQHTLTNAGSGQVTLCRTQNRSLTIGPRRQQVVTAHESCIPAKRVTLMPSESTNWLESISLGPCDEKRTFLRTYFVCPGRHHVLAEQSIYIGAGCTRQNSCARMSLASSTASLLVQRAP